MRVVLKSFFWALAAAGIIVCTSLVLGLSSLGICGPYGPRADMAAWILFPGPQISGFIRDTFAFPPSEIVTGSISLFVFWFLVMLCLHGVIAKLKKKKEVRA